MDEYENTLFTFTKNLERAIYNQNVINDFTIKLLSINDKNDNKNVEITLLIKDVIKEFTLPIFSDVYSDVIVTYKIDIAYEFLLAAIDVVFDKYNTCDSEQQSSDLSNNYEIIPLDDDVIFGIIKKYYDEKGISVVSLGKINGVLTYKRV